MDLDKISKIAEIIIGAATVYSVYLAARALKRSDWNSAMNTAPSILIKPKKSWVGIREDTTVNGYTIVLHQGKLIRDERNYKIKFCIEFECENKGRGSAFNIVRPSIKGKLLQDADRQKVPLYLTLDDDPYDFSVSIEKSYDEWKELQNELIPIVVKINYTNDEGNIVCESFWSADINPFHLDRQELVMNNCKILNRRGGVSYKTV